MTLSDKILWEDMTPKELDAAIERTPLAYWPVGSLEWHGEHLPLGTDSFRAEAIAQRAASISGGVVLPATYMTAPGFCAYRGSIVFSPALVKAIAREMHRELAKAGFKFIVQLLGHGGMAQKESFEEPAAESEKKLGIRILTVGGGASREDLKKIGAIPLGKGHAGPGETAQCIAAKRGVGRLDLFDPQATRLPRYEGLDPAVYYDGLSEPLHDKVRDHMARTEWHWDEDLAEQVSIPGVAETMLQAAALTVARQATEMMKEG